MGLSHGVAVIPNPPKDRFTDTKTGAHFTFEYMSRKIDDLIKERKLKWKNQPEDLIPVLMTVNVNVNNVNREDPVRNT